MSKKNRKRKRLPPQQTLALRARSIFQNCRQRAKKLFRDSEIDFSASYVQQIASAAILSPCIFCGKTISEKNFSLDHIVPISRGGSFSKLNIQICCLDCNTIKGILNNTEFLAILAITHSWDNQVAKNFLARLKAGSRVVRLWTA